jgi:AraC-like DNA-binding protein
MLGMTKTKPGVSSHDRMEVGAHEPQGRVRVTRLFSVTREPSEIDLPSRRDCHGVGIVLRRSDARISVAERTLYEGLAMPGLVQVISPSVMARCRFTTPYDMLHLSICSDLITECTPDTERGAPALDTCVFQDHVVQRLGLSLATSEDLGNRYGQVYADSIGIAIVARVLASRVRGRDGADRARVSALVKWRLKRTLDYIEANLSEPISLGQISEAAGLTRMHFAAQFRVATGLRPHEYLLRRRIERAQELLATPGASLVDVALQVGFQTQAHFTSVFRRYVGRPPHAWRQSLDRVS